MGGIIGLYPLPSLPPESPSNSRMRYPPTARVRVCLHPPRWCSKVSENYDLLLNTVSHPAWSKRAMQSKADEHWG